MAQPWHGGRGSSRGRGTFARSGRGSRRVDHRANVWTPASAAPSALAAPARQASAVAAPPAPPALPPALKARTSARKAADLVQAVSERSAAEIETHLQEVEDRLAAVVAQEEEVRVMADEHLEREAYLTKLLEGLYRKQKEEQDGTSPPADLELLSHSASPCTEKVFAVSTGETEPNAAAPVASAPASISSLTPSLPAAVAAVTVDPTAQNAVAQVAAAEAAVSAPSAQTVSGNPGMTRRRHATGGPRGGSWAGSTALAAVAGGKEPDPRLLLAMAIGGSANPGGDDLFTRDAETIAEYIGLMSSDALAEETSVDRCCQPGLSLTAALDKAEATAACRARMPNLLALAVAIRPLDATVTADGGIAAALGAGMSSDRLSSSSSKRKTNGDAAVLPAVDAVAATMEGESSNTETRGSKRRRVDANAIMCPYELNGKCNDDDCRYQHVKTFFPEHLATRDSPLASIGASSPNVAGPLVMASESGRTASDKGNPTSPVAPPAAAAATGSGESALEPKQQPRLPDIDFSGEREAKRQAAAAGDKGAGRVVAKHLPLSSSNNGVVSKAPDELDGAGEEDSIKGSEGLCEETGSVNGDEDFLALPTESEECEGGDGVSGSTEGEGSPKAVAHVAAKRTSPAVLAEAFARAASGDVIKGKGGRGASGAGARSARSNGGDGQEERYYCGNGSGKSQGLPVAALSGHQLSALETQLNECESCDVEGWLLIVLHKLPRTGDSAAAVLDTVRGVARGPNGPMGGYDQAVIKPALRTFVKPLERAEGGQAEALWLLYLRLFAFLPGKTEDALGMAEYALEKFPASRRIWRLYHSMLQKSQGWSLAKEISCFNRQIEALLLLRSRAAEMAAMQDSSPNARTSGSGSSVQGGCTGAGKAETVTSESGPASGGGGGSGCTSSGENKEDNVIGMVLYLVLERCLLLAECGYKLQAAAEMLDALGALTEGQPLWEWAAADEQGRRSVLRTPSGGGASGGGSMEEQSRGVATALQDALRESRCVLWLAVLHLLIAGVFPRHALQLAENCCSNGDIARTDTDGDTHGAAELLLWSKEWLVSKSSAGFKLPVNEQLQEVILKTFMSALSDVGLLPAKNRGAQGWAPATKDRDALLASAAEAKAARAGGLAPDPSCLEGHRLVLALNWLEFCRGRTDEQQGRMMAIACCRRFQLARPDHPALLEHILLEHNVSKARTVDDIYGEISRAFDPEGVAAEALRERGEDTEGKAATTTAMGSRASDPSVISSPSGDRLQAMFSFLRFVETRFESAKSKSAAAGSEAVEVARRVLHNSLVSMWTATPSSTTNNRLADSQGLLHEGQGESVRRALEGAKAALFCWADGGSGIETTTNSAGLGGRRCRDFPGRNGERQLSTIVVSLWILGGASAAIGALDHLLSAESFSSVSVERRRLAWLQRLEAAVIVSQQRRQGTGEDIMQGAREVALRALADHRTHRRPEYPSLTHFVAATLDRPVVADNSAKKVNHSPPSSFAVGTSESLSSSFSSDVLTLYADRFREVRRGVDWVVVAEALGRNDGSEGRRLTALALLRWVSRAHKSAGGKGAAAGMEDLASTVQRNARPYAEEALARHPGDPGLSGAVATLAIATGSPGQAQRVLEVALRANPFCAVLWEQRIALEAEFGGGSTERAGATAAAAACSSALVRLSCGGPLGGKSPSALQARTAGRIATAISHPSSRRETKSFSLQSLLQAAGPPEGAVSPTAVAVPRSLFLMTGLVSLSLAFNGLHSVPVAIGRLPVLRSLDLSGNLLTALPPSLARLSGTLRILRLAGNQFGSPLAETPIGDLASLRVLDLEYNELSQFPQAVVIRLRELRTLKLAGNAFREGAPAGVSDTLPYLEELTLPALS